MSDGAAPAPAMPKAFGALAILLNPRDDVAVMASSASAGEIVEVRGGTGGPFRLTAEGAIGVGHKIVVRALAAGDVVLKYGEPIGAMSAPAAAGAHVHIHNLVSLRAKPLGESANAALAR